MNKERIIQLLESTCLEDVIIGIQFSYKLPYSDFDNLYNPGRKNNLNNYSPLDYEFFRGGKRYLLGNCRIMYDLYDTIGHFTDITPQIEEP